MLKKILFSITVFQILSGTISAANPDDDVPTSMSVLSTFSVGVRVSTDSNDLMNPSFYVQNLMETQGPEQRLIALLWLIGILKINIADMIKGSQVQKYYQGFEMVEGKKVIIPGSNHFHSEIGHILRPCDEKFDQIESQLRDLKLNSKMFEDFSPLPPALYAHYCINLVNRIKSAALFQFNKAQEEISSLKAREAYKNRNSEVVKANLVGMGVETKVADR